MPIMTFALLGWLAIAPLADDHPASAKLAGDRAKLQGTWTGKLGAQRIDVLMEVAGDKVVLTVIEPADPKKQLVIKGEYKIDEKAKPKTWDFLKGQDAVGKPVPDGLAIYELEGDLLKMCMGLRAKERPAEFKDVNPNSPQLLVLNRRRPSVSADAPKSKPTGK